MYEDKIAQAAAQARRQFNGEGNTGVIYRVNDPAAFSRWTEGRVNVAKGDLLMGVGQVGIGEPDGPSYYKFVRLAADAISLTIDRDREITAMSLPGSAVTRVSGAEYVALMSRPRPAIVTVVELAAQMPTFQALKL